MKKWFIFIVCLWAFQASAQGTYTATSCSLSAISAAIAAEQSHHVDGDIISIPAGSCSWGSGITQTFNNSVTIQGQGAISATTGGASTTGSDLTTITMAFAGPVMHFTTVAGKSFRFTGVAIVTSVASATELTIDGTSTALRVDHCHFNPNNFIGLFIGGSVNGVADHNWFDSPDVLNNAIAVHNGIGWNGSSETGNAKGDHSWNDTEHWGSSRFFFFEDSRWTASDIGDASDSSRYVFRYNTVATTSRGQEYNHGQTNGRGRGFRAAEVYGNTYTRSTTSGSPSFSINSGSLLYWGNTTTNYRYMVQMDYTRKSNGTYNYGTTPSGWGNCDGSTVSQLWDGTSPGYPCLDQPGHGREDLLANDFPNVVNVTQGSVPASTRPDLSPIYIWNNTFNSAGFTPQGYITNTGPTALIADNREYYQQFNASFGESGSFDGTKGVGQGLLSARPSTCTAGPGGNTPGVGYWATDTTTLYVCNPTNTWTAYYTPFTYPHPLTQSFLGTAPAPPTNLSATVN